jgi:Flp pilus assembly protein CpaB
LKRSNRLVLLIGVFLAIVAFVGIVLVLGGQTGDKNPAASAAAPINTVVAAQDIPLGARLTAGMLTVKPFTAGQRRPGAFQEPSQILGQTIRRPIVKDAQLSSADFLDDISQGLIVPEGKRAISVQVNQVNGVGTLIKTGDYVDLVLGLTGSDKFPVVTINPDDESITVVAGINATSVKLLIEGMQVIGTVRPPTTATRTTNAAPSGSAANAPTTTLSDDGQELVILAVTAQQAELIKYAQLDGDISLLLRNSRDFVDEKGEPVVSLPAGTTGVILKTLVDGGYGVLRPELVEAIIPAQ